MTGITTGRGFNRHHLPDFITVWSTQPPGGHRRAPGSPRTRPHLIQLTLRFRKAMGKLPPSSKRRSRQSLGRPVGSRTAMHTASLTYWINKQYTEAAPSSRVPKNSSKSQLDHGTPKIETIKV